jgi:hypothetical protein
MYQMKKAIYWAVVFMMTAQPLMAIEEPEYKVIEKIGDIEIRQYDGYIVAETIVSSEFEEAGNDAFSRLFGYIDGENIRQQPIEMTAPVKQEEIESEGQEIEMTTPVIQEAIASEDRKTKMTDSARQEQLESEGQEIEMTSPVRQETIDSTKYRIAFVMPKQFTLATLPKPKDDRIQIREIPAKKVAVIRYSGTWSEENYKEHEALLYQFLMEKGYKVIGEPVWARYDPPFMPWLFRRNEIMIEIN